MKLCVNALIVMVIPLSALCLAADQREVSDLTLLVTGMKSNSGFVNIAIADSEAGFIENDKAYMQIRTRVHGPDLSMVLKDLPRKEYAISVFHDVNGNNALDRNMRGIPKELYGFSNNARGKFGPPTYGMSRFSLKYDVQTIRINLQ